MRFNNNIPIYIQIMAMLKKQIVSGELQSGDKLLSIRDLAMNLKVSPNTIQRTYQELDKNEVIEIKRGLGRYVTRDVECIRHLKKEMCREIIQHFVQEVKELRVSNEEVVQMIIKDSEDI